MPRKYEKLQELLPVIKSRLSEGKTQREVAEEFGLKDKEVVRLLLTRKRRKERKAAAGIMIRPKGRPRKDSTPRDVIAEQAYEIQRLKMKKLGCLAFSFELCLAISVEPKMNISARRHGRRRSVHSFPAKIG